MVSESDGYGVKQLLCQRVTVMVSESNGHGVRK
jgi:hypothetical protein